MTGTTSPDVSPNPTDVGNMYDQMTNHFTEILGDNIHLGYWDDDHDPATPAQASDRLTDLVADRLAVPAAAEVLDVGCGSGRATARIAVRTKTHVTGITVSPHQVRLALARPETGLGAGQASFQLTDAMDLPFSDGRFAAAFAIESIVHMSDRARAFAGITRVLQPGGTLVTSDFFIEGTLTGDAAEIIRAARAPMALPPFPASGEYQELMGRAGLEVADFVDITDNIRRSHQVIADTSRRLVAELELDATLKTQVLASADLTEQIAALPHLHYALTTARRPA
ncbi:MAG TPA: methyltransferase domain-containing protein [Pseudonocardiaceae bacterium]|jgi:ubiquinone/menaquinone biosynthesis C-methylase UbiE